MKRRDRIANASMDMADLNDSGSLDPRRGDAIRKSLSAREKDIGIRAYDLIASQEAPGWFLDGRMSQIQRLAASLLLSNRRLP